MKFRLPATLALLLTLCFSAPAPAGEAPPDLDLEVLAADYDDNELAADLKYQGRKVRLTAVFTSIGHNYLSGDRRLYARLYAGRPGGWVALDFYFDGDQMAALTRVLDSLVHQRPLTLVCTVGGLEIKSVGFDGCLIDPPPQQVAPFWETRP